MAVSYWLLAVSYLYSKIQNPNFAITIRWYSLAGKF